MVTRRPATRLHIQAVSIIDEFGMLKNLNTSSMLVQWQLHRSCLLKNLKVFLRGMRCHDFSPDDTPQTTLQAGETFEPWSRTVWSIMKHTSVYKCYNDQRAFKVLTEIPIGAQMRSVPSL